MGKRSGRKGAGWDKKWSFGSKQLIKTEKERKKKKKRRKS